MPVSHEFKTPLKASFVSLNILHTHCLVLIDLIYKFERVLQKVNYFFLNRTKLSINYKCRYIVVAKNLEYPYFHNT